MVLAVNIVGGLVIGVVQRGMDVGAAARTYTVLTIGEGLVAQIPALVISTSAGIIVTRVASEEEGAHLGRDIAGQILGQPKAIAIAAGLLAILALVPGLPTIPFLVLAAILGFVAWSLLRTPATVAAAGTATRPGGAASGTAAGAGRSGRAGPEQPAPILTPIAVELGAALSASLCPDGDGAPLAQRLTAALRDRLFAELGIPLPALRVRTSIPGLAPDAYVLRLNEVPLGRGQIAPASDDASPAGQGQVQAQVQANAAILPSTIARAEEILASDVLSLLRRYGHEFIGIQETQGLLEGLERTHPALVREVVPKLISPTLLADVLRRLAGGRDLAAQPEGHPGGAGRLGTVRTRSGHADRTCPRRASPRHHVPPRQSRWRADRVSPRPHDRGGGSRIDPQDVDRQLPGTRTTAVPGNHIGDRALGRWDLRHRARTGDPDQRRYSSLCPAPGGNRASPDRRPVISGAGAGSPGPAVRANSGLAPSGRSWRRRPPGRPFPLFFFPPPHPFQYRIPAPDLGFLHTPPPLLLVLL